MNDPKAPIDPAQPNEDDEPISLELDLSGAGLDNLKKPESSYKPNWTPGMDSGVRGVGMANDHHQTIDDLVSEFLRQQAQLDKDLSQDMSFRGVIRRWRKVIMYTILAVGVAAMVKFQYDLGVERAAQYAELQKQLLEIEINAKKNPTANAGEVNNLLKLKTAKRLQTVKQHEKQVTQAEKMKQWVRIKLLSDKATKISVATNPMKNVKSLVEEKQTWESMLACAAEANWNTKRSAGFQRLRKDLLILASGPYLFSFTPYFAGQEKAVQPPFSDLLQNKVNALMRKPPPDKTNSKNIALVALNDSNGTIQRQSFYFTVTDKSQYLMPPVTAPGKTYESWEAVQAHFRRELTKNPNDATIKKTLAKLPKSGNFSLLQMQSELWVAAEPLVLDSAAVTYLIKEVETQIERFEKTVATLSPESRKFALQANATPVMETQARLKQATVMQQCMRAAKIVNNKKISDFASREDALLQKLLARKPGYRPKLSH